MSCLRFPAIVASNEVLCVHVDLGAAGGAVASRRGRGAGRRGNGTPPKEAGHVRSVCPPFLAVSNQGKNIVMGLPKLAGPQAAVLAIAPALLLLAD